MVAELDGRRPRPVVVDFGPCDIFAALVLAQMGRRPIVLARGMEVCQRTKDTWGLWRWTAWPFSGSGKAAPSNWAAATRRRANWWATSSAASRRRRWGRASRHACPA
jgi:hypothetical protein